MAIYLPSALPEALRLGTAHQELRGSRKSRDSVEFPCQTTFSNRRVSNPVRSNRFTPPSAKGSDPATSGGATPGSPPDTWRRLMPSTSSPPGLGQFRPPSLPIPGSGSPRLRSEGGEEAEDQAKRIGELLDLVRDSRGPWQERAAAISALQREGGYTTESLYDLTYLSIDKQTTWVVAAQVYESLVSEGASEDILAEFGEPLIDIMYELRTLSQRQRKAAAEYVVEENLTVEGSKELAKAIKDHERRPTGREGFTVAPGDCLAFAMHRTAQETRDSDTKDAFIARGLELVVTESARARFSEF